MNFDKSKVLSIVGMVLTSVIATLLSTKMQDNSIEKNVQKHFDALESKEEA